MFLIENPVDQRAMDAFLEADPAVQRAVLDRGSLADTSNPSSALMSRIRGRGDSHTVQNSSPGMGGRGSVGDRPSEGGLCNMGSMGSMGSKGNTAGKGGMGGRMGGMGFATTLQLQLQQQAVTAAALAAATRQGIVLSGIGGFGGRGLMGGSQAPGRMGAKQAKMGKGEVEGFIVSNHLDDGAAQNLREEAPEVQAYVIDRGSLAEVSNPSSAVMGRIRDAKFKARSGNGRAAVMGLGDIGTAAPDVERFIADNRLDDGAARNMRQQAREVQVAVIERGTLAECANPSSALMGRIKDAKANSFGRGSSHGDYGEQKHHTQRAEIGYGRSYGQDGARASTASAYTTDVEEFISQNLLDDSAAQSLRSEADDVIQAVLERGGLGDCKNPSSAVMGRIRDAKAKVGGDGYGSSGGRSGGGRSGPY